MRAGIRAPDDWICWGHSPQGASGLDRGKSTPGVRLPTRFRGPPRGPHLPGKAASWHCQKWYGTTAVMEPCQRDVPPQGHPGTHPTRWQSPSLGGRLCPGVRGRGWPGRWRRPCRSPARWPHRGSGNRMAWEGDLWDCGFFRMWGIQLAHGTRHKGHDSLVNLHTRPTSGGRETKSRAVGWPVRWWASG